MERGAKSEERFYQAWRDCRLGATRHYNQFILSVERPSLEEDCVGKTDAFIFTLLSKQVIRIQIKSSVYFARHFLQKDLPIPVVVIRPTDSSDQIRRRTIFEIVNMFPFLRKEIEERGCILPQLINYYKTK